MPLHSEYLKYISVIQYSTCTLVGFSCASATKLHGWWSTETLTVTYKGHDLTFVWFPHNTTMSGCTLKFTRNSPLRTILVDEATGDGKYRIDTPRTLVRGVTRIRKLDPSTQPPLHWDDSDSDADDDSVGQGKEGESKSDKDRGDGEEAGAELPETSDEIARIYWKWFSSDRIVFRGKITDRSEFLPKCGKMKGYVHSCYVLI